jgi:hypothetical protein
MESPQSQDCQFQFGVLEDLLAMLENHVGTGATSCITFGLPASAFSEGGPRLREEIANAANIRSRL